MINESILRIERQLGLGASATLISGAASGIPLGGEAGQILAKQSNSNYDTHWIDQPTAIVASTEFLLQTVYNGSGATINKGEAVCIAGAEGSTIVVGKAIANSIHDSEVIGVALDNILNNEYGSVVIHGIIDALDTNSFSEGDRLYLSTTSYGQITNIEPSAPNHSILIGYCVKKDAADGAIYVDVNTGGHLNGLHDVSLNLPSSGDFLFFDNDGIWKNKKIESSDISDLTGILSGLYPVNNPSGFITGIQNLVYTTGSQLVSGIKTFEEGLEVGPSIGLSTLYVSSLGAVGINNENPQAALDVSGSSMFSQRPTVNGTGVLLQGEVQNNTIISGVVYSAQVNVKNGEGSTIYKGQPVYIKGSDGANMIIGLASNTGEATSSKTLGLVVQDSLAQNAFGTVITDGLLQNFNASSANAGDPVWLGPTGSLIYGLTNKPYAPNHLVYLGVVTRPQNNGEIFVKVQNGYELNELHDVSVTGISSGEFLFRNNNLWSGKNLNIQDISGLQQVINSKQVTGDYYTSNNPSGFITSGQTGLFYPTSNPSGFIVSTDLSNYISITGNQTISGSKTFVAPPLETKAAPTISAGALTLDLSSASLFYVILNSAVSITLTNVPASPSVHSFTLQFVADGTARAVIWPAGTRWAGGTIPTPTSTLNKVDTFTFMTHDGGTNWFAFVSSQNQ